MPGYFFDSSGVVKRYVNERGSPWVAGVLAASIGNEIHVARITGVEVVSALVRRGRSGGLGAAGATAAVRQFRQDLVSRYRVVAVTPTLLVTAMDLAEIHALRGYDAVQLAAALLVNARRIAKGRSPITLVSADAALNAAALLKGLRVEDPNTHP